jgi:hypothetical protein
MRRLLLTSALGFAAAGCSGADTPTVPARSLTGAWTGASALVSLGLDLRSSGGAVGGRGWIAPDRVEGLTPGTYAALTPAVAVPVQVTGAVQDSTFVLTLTPDLPAGASFGYTLDPVVLRGTARDGALDARFDVTYPGLPSPGAQAAVLAPDADSVARGRLTMRAAPPGGGAARVDLVRTASAWVGRAILSRAGGTVFALGSFPSDPGGILIELTSGRPAVGRHVLAQGLGGTPAAAVAHVPPACQRRSCPDYSPTAGAPGELVITRSTARAVSGTFRFTGVRVADGVPPDTLVFEGAFDAPCGSRGC